MILNHFQHLCLTDACWTQGVAYEKTFPVTPPVRRNHFTAVTKLNAVLGVTVSCLAVVAAVGLIIVGRKSWGDFRVGLFICISVIVWSLTRIVALGFVLQVIQLSRGLSYYGENSHILMGMGWLTFAWSDAITIVLQTLLFALLFYQWMLVFLASASERTQKILKGALIFVMCAVVIVFIGVMAQVTVLAVASTSLGSEITTVQFSVRLVTFLRVMFMVILILVVGVGIVMIVGLFWVEKREDKIGLVKFLVLIFFIFSGFLLRAIFFFSISKDVPESNGSQSSMFGVQLLLSEVLIVGSLICLVWLGIRAVNIRLAGFKKLRESEGLDIHLLNSERSSSISEDSIPSQYDV
jgi:hypothetical protein